MKEELELIGAAIVCMLLFYVVILLIIKFFFLFVFISFAAVLAIGLLGTSGGGDGREKEL